MKLVPVIRNLDRSEPSMRVSGNKVTFNVAAVLLLGLRPDGYVRLMFDDDYRRRLWICRADNGSNAWKVSGRQGRNVLMVQSRVLAHYLQETLEGFGLYRICPEDRTEYGDMVYYSIFHKRYD